MNNEQLLAREKYRFKLLLELDSEFVPVGLHDCKKYNHFHIVKTMMAYIKKFMMVPPEHIWEFKIYLNYDKYMVTDINIKNPETVIKLKNMDGKKFTFTTSNDKTFLDVYYYLKKHNFIKSDINDVVFINPDGKINNTVKLKNVNLIDTIFVIDKTN